MPHPNHSPQRRVLMATTGGTLALIAATPSMEGLALGAFAQFLRIETARASVQEGGRSDHDPQRVIPSPLQDRPARFGVPERAVSAPELAAPVDFGGMAGSRPSDLCPDTDADQHDGAESLPR